MKNCFQHGQALVEYFLGLAGVVIVAIGGARFFFKALEDQWDTLAFWLTLPNP
jgi:hypothetical protein